LENLSGSGILTVFPYTFLESIVVSTNGIGVVVSIEQLVLLLTAISRRFSYLI
jgi:hypothetical protein